MRVSAKTQQRLVQRQAFAAPAMSEPVKEASIDGGTIRLIVESGQQPFKKQYKAVHLAPMQVHAAWLEDNWALLEWLNDQVFVAPLTCLGDGHNGIWNLFAQVSLEVERREIQGLVSLDGKPGEGGRFTQTTGTSPQLVMAGQSG